MTCEDCGKCEASLAWSDSLGVDMLCDRCYDKRANYDPPDADGDDICRDPAAELRDAMDLARGLKR